MKKICLILIVLPCALVLQFCSSSRKVMAPAKMTYMSNIQPIMVSTCTPCHFPPKGNKKPYDNYLAVKTDIDSILNRIQRDPTERGFMPARHPKLSDSTIMVFKQWQKDGLLEN